MQSNAPVDGPAPIQTSEYRGRLSRVQAEMASTGLAALFITSEDNFRWLTGFNAPVWQNLTRPRYCIVPAHGDPVLILPSGNDVISNRTAAWIRDVRSWAAPNPDDDGVTLVIDALAGCAGAHRRIGAELGRESRVTMPIGDFLRIRDGIAPAQMVDADWMLRTLRMVKSPAEIAIMRHVCQLVSRAFEALPGLVRIGDTERDVAAAFQCEVLRNGGEKIPYLICTSGAGGYPCSNMGPSDRVLEAGDVLMIDTGVSFDGYYCDFDRDYAFGPPSGQVRQAYDFVWRATEAGIAAARPGQRACDVWRAQAEVLAGWDNAGAEKEGFGVGRYGHGVGLRMCEPPSNSPIDEQPLLERDDAHHRTGSDLPCRRSQRDGETGAPARGKRRAHGNGLRVAHPSRAARDPGHRVMRRIVIVGGGGVGGRPGSFGAHQGGAPSISPIDIPSACSTIGTTRSAHSSMLRMALALS